MRKAPTIGALVFSVAAALCVAVLLNDAPAAPGIARIAGAVMVIFAGSAGWTCGTAARSLSLAGKRRHARSVVVWAALMLALFCGLFWFVHKRLIRGGIVPAQGAS